MNDKGDVDEFNIEWGISQGFLTQAEQWETHVTHRTMCLKINVVFPRSRPPQHIVLIEGNRRRSHDLDKRVQVPPAICWLINWGSPKPLRQKRLHSPEGW